MDLTIACTLTAEQRAERRHKFQSPIFARLLSVDSVPEGYVYTFPASVRLWADLMCLVSLERECCRFLSFRLVAREDERTIHLIITGPPEARLVIADLFHD
jgi:hypothetical protein